MAWPALSHSHGGGHWSALGIPVLSLRKDGERVRAVAGRRG